MIMKLIDIKKDSVHIMSHEFESGDLVVSKSFGVGTILAQAGRKALRADNTFKLRVRKTRNEVIVPARDLRRATKADLE